MRNKIRGRARNNVYFHLLAEFKLDVGHHLLFLKWRAVSLTLVLRSSEGPLKVLGVEM